MPSNTDQRTEAIKKLAALALATIAIAGCATGWDRDTRTGEPELSKVRAECVEIEECAPEAARQWITDGNTGRIAKGRWKAERWVGDATAGTLITRTDREPAHIPRAAERAAKLNQSWWQDTKKVELTIIDGAILTESTAAINTGKIIVIGEAWNRPEEREWLAAHETAHEWWRGHSIAIDEGMAEVTARIATGASMPQRLGLNCESGKSTPQCLTKQGLDEAWESYRHDKAAFDKAVQRWTRNPIQEGGPERPPWQ